MLAELGHLIIESSSLDVFIDNINVTLVHVIAVIRYKSMVIKNWTIYAWLKVWLKWNIGWHILVKENKIIALVPSIAPIYIDETRQVNTIVDIPRFSFVRSS